MQLQGDKYLTYCTIRLGYEPSLQSGKPLACNSGTAKSFSKNVDVIEAKRALSSTRSRHVDSVRSNWRTMYASLRCVSEYIDILHHGILLPAAHGIAATRVTVTLTPDEVYTSL
jgi:hypothetical protein